MCSAMSILASTSPTCPSSDHRFSDGTVASRRFDIHVASSSLPWATIRACRLPGGAEEKRDMRSSVIGTGVLVIGFAVVGMTSRTRAGHPPADFGTFVESQLSEHSEQLFGIKHPLEQSALGPYDGPNNLQAIQVAPGLQVSL